GLRRTHARSRSGQDHRARFVDSRTGAFGQESELFEFAGRLLRESSAECNMIPVDLYAGRLSRHRLFPVEPERCQPEAEASRKRNTCRQPRAASRPVDKNPHSASEYGGADEPLATDELLRWVSAREIDVVAPGGRPHHCEEETSSEWKTDVYALLCAGNCVPLQGERSQEL